MRKLYFALTLMCLACFMSVPAFANTLLVVLEKDSDVKIDGASIEIYKIADVRIDGKNAIYTFLPDYFQMKDISFENMTVAKSMSLAEQLSDIAKNPVRKGITDMEGSFQTEVGNGMYLIKEADRTGTAKEYKPFSPFLVSVPIYDEETGWDETVIARPKTTIIAEPTPSVKPDESEPTPTTKLGPTPTTKPDFETPAVTKTPTPIVTNTPTSEPQNTPAVNQNPPQVSYTQTENNAQPVNQTGTNTTQTQTPETVNTSDGTLKTVRTGDESHLIWYLGLLFAGLILIVMKERSQNR